MSAETWERLLAAHEGVAERRSIRHEPTAAVLACSDARVPPSIVFDQPAGSLFVIRIAGNTAVPAARASLDYAVATLGVDTIIVMGHTNCGAVQAAAQGTCGGHLEPIVSSICEVAGAHPDAGPDEIAALNVARTVRDLRSHDGPTGAAYAAGRVDILGALHDLGTGRLEPVPVPETPIFTTPVPRNHDATEASP